MKNNLITWFLFRVKLLEMHGSFKAQLILIIVANKGFNNLLIEICQPLKLH